MPTGVEATLRAHMQRDTPRELAIPRRVPATGFPDLLLDLHKAVLDPSAKLDV